MSYRTISLHGHRVSYREAGSDGPLLLLIHGMAGSSRTWAKVLEGLGDHARVIAPDLLGHGQSAKPRGDYSLGAFASGLRDLLVALGHDRATVVGHSLGGGIAMQFTYQYPEHVERLVLVGSGGLGREVHPVLRFCAAPGAEIVLPLVCNSRVREAGMALRRQLERLPWKIPARLDEIGRSYDSLLETPTRTAFVHTLRSGVDVFGQRIDATDRLHLAAAVPMLIVWGAKDRVIPLRHATRAHDLIPASRLEIFPDAGHYPHVEDPHRFVRILRDFVASTEPATLRVGDFREQIARPTALAAP
jgi:pimeloyl-ACP methyl ester carboxylesterase